MMIPRNDDTKVSLRCVSTSFLLREPVDALRKEGFGHSLFPRLQTPSLWYALLITVAVRASITVSSLCAAITKQKKPRDVSSRGMAMELQINSKPRPLHINRPRESRHSAIV